MVSRNHLKEYMRHDPYNPMIRTEEMDDKKFGKFKKKEMTREQKRKIRKSEEFYGNREKT